MLTTGPDDPHAFENIPVQERLDFADHKCAKCGGHGEWNAEVFGGGRCIVKMCDVCHGFGWLGHNGETARMDIIQVNGHPQWVLLIDKHLVD